jgi:hypothetical protein
MHEDLAAILDDAARAITAAQADLEDARRPEAATEVLRHITNGLDDLRDAQAEAARWARRWNVPWSSIGDATGMTKQAAWERYRDTSEAPSTPPEPKPEKAPTPPRGPVHNPPKKPRKKRRR